MPEPPTVHPSATSLGEADAAVRTQIMATEHWSLLSTRSMVWNESFGRGTWFLTVVSATVLALALVAEATDFGAAFRNVALLLLPILVVVGLATFHRLLDLNREDVRLVIGMNRLRRGYLTVAPELEPYFITSHHDDRAGIMQTSGGSRPSIPVIQYLSSYPLLVGIVDAVLVGAVIGLIVDALGAGLALAVTISILAMVATLAGLVLIVVRHVNRTWNHHPLFPS